MMYGFWDTERDRQTFLLFWTIFWTFIALTTWKIKILKKRKYYLELLSLYTRKEIWEITWELHKWDMNENYMIYGSWDKKCDKHNFLSLWTVFWPFSHLTTLKIKNSIKNKQKPGDIIILHKCSINDNHTTYGFWDMKRNGHNFLSFWTVFWPNPPAPPPLTPYPLPAFSAPNNPKNQNFEKLKPGDTIILHRCNLNENHMTIQKSFCHFEPFFELLLS